MEVLNYAMHLILMGIIVVNILFSITLIIKHFITKKNNNLVIFSIINNRKNIFKYYLLYVILFIIFYELSYFQNLYSANYYYVYIYFVFIYLNLIPIIIIFLYVLEKNNSINTQYLLFKDRLLKKSLLVVKTFILSFVNLIAVIVISMLLIPVVFYLIYYIHILFGITPDILDLGYGGL